MPVENTAMLVEMMNQKWYFSGTIKPSKYVCLSNDLIATALSTYEDNFQFLDIDINC